MKALLIALAALLTMPLALLADQAQADKIFHALLAAQAARDYQAFLADANDEIKTALTKQKFDTTADILNKHLADGYETTPLGELNQQGYEVYLYRLRLKKGGDDLLGVLSIKDGKVGGIYFK